MIFKKKPSTNARQRLHDPEFPCSAPEVPMLRVDYDPAVWVRFPTLGQDRTSWVQQVLAAFAEDLGWSARSPEHTELEAQLNSAANQPADYTASLLRLSRRDGAGTASIDALDEEGMLLKYGDPDQFLAYRDVGPDVRCSRSTFGKDRLEVSDVTGYDDGERVLQWRVHRQLLSTPAVHLNGVAFAGDGRAAGDILLLFAGARVPR